MLVLYPKLGDAIHLDSLLSFTDISETLRPFFQYINYYCKLHNVEKNWKILVHTLTPLRKNDIDCGVYLCLNAYKVLMDPDDINEKPSFRQEENLAIRFWIAYMCETNNSSPSRIHSTTDNNTETANIDYTIFHQDTNLEFVDAKNCLGNFSYSNEWEALLTAKLCKGGNKAKYSSEDEESKNVDDAYVDLQCAADEVAISKRYQAFFGSWIMNKLKEWKCSPSSGTSPTYRLQCCHLGRGVNIVNIGQKERAAATQHFKDIKLELIEKVILEELTYGEHANELK